MTSLNFKQATILSISRSMMIGAVLCCTVLLVQAQPITPAVEVAKSIPHPDEYYNRTGKYFDYNDLLVTTEWCDHDFVYGFWRPPKDSDPTLLLMYKEQTEEEWQQCIRMSSEPPLDSITYPGDNWVSCFFYSFALVYVEYALVPSANCTGNVLDPYCAPVPGYELHGAIEEYYVSARRLLWTPPTIIHTNIDYKHVITFELVEGIAGLSTLYESSVTPLLYRLEEKVIGSSGQETNDWQTIYIGKENHYIPVVHKESTRVYRGYIRSNETNKTEVWSKPSNNITVIFQFADSSPEETPTQEEEREKILARKLLIRYVLFATSGILFVASLVIAYACCYRKLGLCRRVEGGVPKPKLLVRIADDAPPSHRSPHNAEANRGDEFMEMATPLTREKGETATTAHTAPVSEK